jgi:host factor-I protein
MQKSASIQDLFLNQLRKERTNVAIHLINGFQLRGIVRSFDNFVVVIESEGKQMMIYKHALSSITPAQPIRYGEANEEPEANA